MCRDLTICQPLSQVIGIQMAANEDNLVAGDGAVPRLYIEGAAFAAELKDVLVGAFVEPQQPLGTKDLGGQGFGKTPTQSRRFLDGGCGGHARDGRVRDGRGHGHDPCGPAAQTLGESWRRRPWGR